MMFVPKLTNTAIATLSLLAVNAMTAGASNVSIVVFGSSVAQGVGSSSPVMTNGSYVNGYAGLMTAFLAGKGITVTNASLPGDTSYGAVTRFPTAVIPLAPNNVFIGYSLGNDGLDGSTNPAATVANFLANLTNVVTQCRSHGFYPVIGSVYAKNDYTLVEYGYLKAAHLAINSWNVPSLNFLGSIDDGTGHWVNGYYFDALHPDDAGHQEMFYTFVPTLFDSIAAGKTNSPGFASPTQFARLTQNAGVTAPITFTPSNTMHSFTVSFRVRSAYNGTVAAIRTGTNYATLQILAGQLVYVSTNGLKISLASSVTNGDWHDVALSYRYSLQQTALIVDGTLAGTLKERYVPDQFTLGGPSGASGQPAAPSVADFKNWCVYRSAWSTNEAIAQMQGNLQQSSMEICAALDDASFAPGIPATNRAQSLSVAIVNTTNLTAMQDVSPPGNLTAQLLPGEVGLAWIQNPAAGSGLVIERRLTGTSAWSDLVLLPPGSASYTDSGVTLGVSYDYRVAASVGGQQGNYSNIASATVANGFQQGATNSIASLQPGDPTFLTAYAATGFSYITERATNVFGPWVPIATNSPDSHGVIPVADSFSDLQGNQPSSAFYRLKWQQ